MMSTAAYKRDGRINTLHQRALKGKYQVGGTFSYTALILDAKAIGVHQKTAESYADTVVSRLKKAGHLK